MKKVLSAGGARLARAWMVVAILGASLLSSPASVAQVQYNLTFLGFPSGSADLSTYIGLDRKLKADVPGHILQITITPPLTTPKRVRLSVVVSATGSSVKECNTQIATANTQEFTISGSGRNLGASDFTGSSGIGIQTSTEYQPCIDALADYIQKGVASIPAGSYRIDAVLNDAATGAVLGTGGQAIQIESSSTNEAVLNLTSPQDGERVPQSASIVFSFNNSIPGRLVAFEHSSLSQSPEDATRDLNSPLKVFDVEVTARGSNQIAATSPGIAKRPWMAGKKISWLFLGQLPGSSEIRRSPVWSFTIVSNDPIYNQLSGALSNAPDPVASTFTNLINSGYILAFSGSNPIRLQEGDNGIEKTIDVTQLLSLFSDLSRRNVHLNASVTSQ